MDFVCKEFSLNHSKSTMKVGTDAILLASVVKCYFDDLLQKEQISIKKVLDVGCGCGILSLCMAQEFLKARITAIDIDKSSVEESQENFLCSKFADRLTVKQMALQDMINVKDTMPHQQQEIEQFDIIISNPPFFTSSLVCPDKRRAKARHNDTLPLSDLVLTCIKIMSLVSFVCVILPTKESLLLQDLFIKENINPVSIYDVFAKENGSSKRQITIYSNSLSLKPQEQKIFIRDKDNTYTQQYKQLTSPFLL